MGTIIIKQSDKAYYHVKVEYGDVSSPKNRKAYGFDFTDLEEVKSDIVKPFLLHKPFLVDGAQIEGSVRLLKVFESQYPIDTCVDLVNRKTPPNVVVFFSKEDILPEEDYVADITKDVIKSVQLALNNPDETKASSGKHINKGSREVFVVHGHDDGARESVEAFLRSLELVPIILFEQENKGQTIIEKIEAHANVSYAIVLYTPCDLGKANEEDTLKSRARQNVVFEHGYLMASLGRDRITALVKGEVETPGDLGGMVYIAMDPNNAWKYKIAKELRSVGIDVDFSKIVM